MDSKTTITPSEGLHCYHCGDLCPDARISIDDHYFCCKGCLTVYEILGSGELCTYYDLQNAPGNKLGQTVLDKFLILDEPKVANSFLLYEDENDRQVTFFIPYMHCSSCIYLLQNLHRLNTHIHYSTVNFAKKKVQISYQKNELKLSELAQLLATVGYAPMLNEDSYEGNIKRNPRVVEIGVAGFCFGNIMLFTFPEYLGLSISGSDSWLIFFRWLSFALCLPVVFFAAREFWSQAYAGMKHRVLNINTPVALALMVIFGRSCFELFTHSGAGYFDSLAGLVFFMLVGRYVQDKTLGNLNHDRDFRAHFPLAYQVERQGEILVESLDDIRPGDQLYISQDEILPMDGILVDDEMLVDYSFLTGENIPKHICKNEKLFAGGKNKGSAKKMMVTKIFSQSQFASLWQNAVFADDQKRPNDFLDKLSWYFTIAVIALSFAAFGYWYWAGQSHKAWDALSTALIVACPCALLLSATFARGFVTQRLFAKDVFLKSSEVLKELRKVKRIVFDKTGTLTKIDENNINYDGKALSSMEKQALVAVMSTSRHPLSQMLRNIIRISDGSPLEVESIKETEQSIEGWVDDHHIQIGTPMRLGLEPVSKLGIEIVLLLDQKELGRFNIRNRYKKGIAALFEQLHNYPISVLSGDRAANKNQLIEELNFQGEALFELTAQQKLDIVQQLESQEPTMVIGDGVNDAGAIRQATVGVALVENNYAFSPANDIMILNDNIKQIPHVLKLGHKTRQIISLTFLYSLVYNVLGLSFALSGELTPVLAAILMPASSIGIILISYISSYWVTKKL